MNNENKKTEPDINPQKQKKGFHFWEDGFSIDESRISVLIIILVVLITFVIVMACFNIPIPDIPAGFKDIITTLIWAVCGVNVFNKVSAFFNPYGNMTNGSGGYNNYSMYGNYGTSYVDPTLTNTATTTTSTTTSDQSLSDDLSDNSTSNLGRDGV